MKNRWIIDYAPLQLYSSAIIFTPRTSIIRTTFEDKIPKWITRLPKVPLAWTAELQQFEGPYPFRNIAFSPGGRLLASASYDTIRLWDVEPGEQVQNLGGHTHSLYAVAFSPDGGLLASGSDDDTVRLWDVETGEQVQKLGWNAYRVNAVTFSPDGRLLASASNDKTIRLWDVETGVLVQQLEGHRDTVNVVTFSPNGRLLASTSSDGMIKLWDMATAKQFWQVETGSDLWLLWPLKRRRYFSRVNVDFSPDGKLLASTSTDGMIRLLETATGNQVRKIGNHKAW